ncbi:STAS domain-containing protein [Pseudomonas sp. MWU16-30317]|uniref:STAS domain-containing protein n=1 Tax=Pseudomonas sp. MWU16-30317 TaxID=2878095 RepID=UPI001CF9C24D|nr:STAS domain-containing protein [Pseudomonas sp. MWU16-30317]
MYDECCLLQRVVVKEGNLTIDTAEAQYTVLLELISLSRELEIDLSDVISIDAEGLKLIITAKVESIRLGRRLLISHPNEAIVTAFECRGLRRLLQL